MVAMLALSDLSGQRRYETDFSDEDVSPDHTVGQVLEHYLERMEIAPDDRDGLRWSAYSRGVRLDNNRRVADLPETENDWMVMPNVSAG